MQLSLSSSMQQRRNHRYVPSFGRQRGIEHGGAVATVTIF